MFLTGLALNTLAVLNGFGKHTNTLSSDQVKEALKWNFIGQALGILSLAFARIGFSMTLYTILSPQQYIQRNLLRLVVIMQLLLNVSLSILILAQCKPAAGLWDPSLQAVCLSPSIQEHYGFVQGCE